ncbi:MAG: EVE domain-containing protein [Actinobacteria bacterium QS_5_72_10]|nr:MAG: EVE domain-containing protein [Actinobacteria bacterium QS_5_72_10]
MAVWCITMTPDNFAKTAELGWRVQGLKSRREKTARRIQPSDKLVFYISKAQAFGATVEVASDMFEDHELIWTSTPDEDYPWRFEIVPEVVVEDSQAWVPAEDLYDDLAFVKKWPREHWKLAFQGNVREWPWEDYEVVTAALQQAAG